MSRLILCSVLALSAPAPVRADDAEDETVAFVEMLGGKVNRDDKRPNKPVTGVVRRETRATDTSVKELAAFKNLVQLNLRNTSVASLHRTGWHVPTLEASY